MMVSGSFCLLLLALACSGGTPSSAQDQFYLTLRRVEGEDDAELWGSGSTTNTNESQSDDTCEFRSRSVPVSCSCGSTLIKSNQKYEDSLNATCDSYAQLENCSSLINFCNSSLASLVAPGQGYSIHKVPVPADSSTSGMFFTKDSLEERMCEMEGELRVFRRVLDRTLAGVLIETEPTKCFCFVSCRNTVSGCQLRKGDTEETFPSEGSTSPIPKHFLFLCMWLGGGG